MSNTGNGGLMIFDNGTAGGFPPNPFLSSPFLSNPFQPNEEGESFALSHRTDEENMTAAETWCYGGADLPNGNRFVACSGIKLDLDENRIEILSKGVGTIEYFEVTSEKEVGTHASTRSEFNSIIYSSSFTV